MSRVTLTGKFTRIDGSPATGTVRVTPSRSPIMDSAGRVVISGPQSFPVQSGGLLEVDIPASNDPDLGPAFTYRIEVILDHASWKISKVWIPHGSATVDLSEIGDYEPVPGVATRVVTIPADGTDGQVLVWDGAGFSWMDAPAGPPGPPGEVTTAALTTALAGKVSGTGMTVRVDTTVGTRVFLDHPGGSTMLYGDTGWRTLTSWDTAGTVTGEPLRAGMEPTPGQAGSIICKRVNGTVYVGLKSVRLTTNSVIPLPVGFRPTSAPEYTSGAAAVISATQTLLLSAGAGGAGYITASSFPTTISTSYFVQLQIHISAPWPTTLPGLPA